jgi:hypothetical protein
MNSRPDPVAVCLKAFLDALAAQPQLMSDYVQHREATIRQWFVDNPCDSGGQEEAIAILVAGDFRRASATLMGPGDSQAAWLTGTTIWLV